MELSKALDILGLDYNCTKEDIKKAYRALLKNIIQMQILIWLIKI